MTILRIIKQKRFIIGFLILIIILFASFTFKSLIEPNYPIKTQYWVYNQAGELVDRAPFAPSLRHPLGTDLMGVPMELKLIAGAKYTIGIALGVVVIRFFGGLILGVIFSFFREKPYQLIFYIFNTFNYVPETLLAFAILAPIDAIFVWSFTIHQQMLLSFVTLAVIGIPNLSIQIASEIREVKHNEFIAAAHLMGGGPIHILWKHVKPFISAKLVILIKQQIVQVLVIIVALAILGIKLTGVTQGVQAPDLGVKDPAQEGVTVTKTVTSEWGGLIQDNREQVWANSWMIYDPAIAFCITIINFQMMCSAVIRVIQGDDLKRRRKRIWGQSPTTLKK
ncbi:MAG: ABC transporter permease [Tuberibacillus sp.]